MGKSNKICDTNPHDRSKKNDRQGECEEDSLFFPVAPVGCKVDVAIPAAFQRGLALVSVCPWYCPVWASRNDLTFCTSASGIWRPT